MTKLDVNCGDKHHLHGGEIGFHRRMWESEIIENGVCFKYLSKDGDDKYPGEVQVSVSYVLKENTLMTEMNAYLTDG